MSETEYEFNPITITEYEFMGRELSKNKLHLMDLISLAILNMRFSYKYKRQYRKNILTWDKVIDDDKLVDYINEIKPITSSI